MGEIALTAMLHICILPQLRAFVLRLFGAGIGGNCIVHPITIINFYRGSLRNLKMGNDCFIGQESLIDLAAPVELGSRVTIAPRVNVFTHMNVGYSDHPLQQAFPSRADGVIIEDGCFVGAASTILAGSRIGAGSCVAAGAVVSGNIPAHTLAGGVPAAPIRTIQVADTDPVVSESCRR